MIIPYDKTVRYAANIDYGIFSPSDFTVTWNFEGDAYTGLSADYKWSTLGNHEVYCKVVNNVTGGIAIKSQTVTQQPVALSIEITNPAQDDTLYTGQEYAFSATLNVPLSEVNLVWQFSNGFTVTDDAYFLYTFETPIPDLLVSCTATYKLFPDMFAGSSISIDVEDVPVFSGLQRNTVYNETLIGATDTDPVTGRPCKLYLLEGIKDEKLYIRAASKNISTYLGITLYNGTFEKLVDVGVSSGSYASPTLSNYPLYDTGHIKLPYTGNYYVSIQAKAGNSPADFDLCVPSPAKSYGNAFEDAITLTDSVTSSPIQLISSKISSSPTLVYSYYAEANDIIKFQGIVDYYGLEQVGVQIAVYDENSGFSNFIYYSEDEYVTQYTGTQYIAVQTIVDPYNGPTIWERDGSLTITETKTGVQQTIPEGVPIVSGQTINADLTNYTYTDQWGQKCLVYEIDADVNLLITVTFTNNDYQVWMELHRVTEEGLEYQSYSGSGSFVRYPNHTGKHMIIFTGGSVIPDPSTITFTYTLT